jgi:hypothetical protein
MPDGQRGAVRGQADHPTSWQKYLPPNCAPMPNCAVSSRHLLLQVVVAEGVPELRARRRQASR